MSLGVGFFVGEIFVNALRDLDNFIEDILLRVCRFQYKAASIFLSALSMEPRILSSTLELLSLFPAPCATLG